MIEKLKAAISNRKALIAKLKRKKDRAHNKLLADQLQTEIELEERLLANDEARLEDFQPVDKKISEQISRPFRPQEA